MKQLTLRPRVAAAPLRTRRPTNTDVLLLVYHREATSFVNFLTQVGRHKDAVLAEFQESNLLPYCSDSSL